MASAGSGAHVERILEILPESNNKVYDVRKVMNWLNAMCLATVPKIALVLRKSYGLAVSNMGAGGNADELAAWASAD